MLMRISSPFCRSASKPFLTDLLQRSTNKRVVTLFENRKRQFFSIREKLTSNFPKHSKLAYKESVLPYPKNPLISVATATFSNGCPPTQIGTLGTLRSYCVSAGIDSWEECWKSKFHRVKSSFDSFVVKESENVTANFKSSMKKTVSILVLISFLFMAGCAQPTQEIYVSPDGNSQNSGMKEAPFQTIEAAIEKARAYKRESNDAQIVIHLLEGEYFLNAPIKITSDLSDLKIVGEGLDKVVIKGSKKLNLDWETYKGEILVAKVGNDILFDQLFINGKQQILARYPNYDENGGHWQGHAADAISKERVRSWKNPVGAIVHAMHSGEWGGFHYKILKANEDGTLEFMGGHQNNRPSKMHDTYRMVENVFEELDSPGEWFLDQQQQLYYWPTENLDINDALVEGVVLKHLVEIVGDENSPVANISISGVKFEHAQRTIMEEYEPLLRSDWTIYRGAALFIENAEHISLEDCEFANLGGNVIFVSKYNRNVKISGNHIHDCGASAISFVGDPSAVRSPSFQYGKFVNLSEMDKERGPANSKYPSECTVHDNLIYRIGRVEKQVAGVQISMAMKIAVSSNSIYDVPRSGINISEGTWGF